MAWNVVIAGGGFGGAAAARELERLLPKQSARLILVNDVNFMLYTPFLPEAAAGTLEPRHVVTPLRDILDRTYLRLGAIVGHDPATKTVTLHNHEGETEEIAYDQFLVAVGSVSRSLPVPGLDQHAIGFKSLADAIWLRNHVIETLEQANATEDAAQREELLTYVFVGGGYSGLEALAELQDFAADAMDSYPRARLHGMRWILVEAMDRVLPEVPAALAEYALHELRGRGIDIRLGTKLEEARGDGCRLSTGEEIPTRTIVWTAGVAPHPSIRNLELPLTDTWRVDVDETMKVRGHGLGLGDRRLRRRPRPREGRQAAVPADRAACRPPGQGRRPQHRRRARRRPRRAEEVHLQSEGIVRQPRPLQGGRQAQPGIVPWVPRLVDGADLPHEPDPGRGAQGPRRRRLDRRAAVQARRSRGRLDRPPAPAPRRGLRQGRHPPPGRLAPTAAARPGDRWSVWPPGRSLINQPSRDRAQDALDSSWIVCDLRVAEAQPFDPRCGE